MKFILFELEIDSSWWWVTVAYIEGRDPDLGRALLHVQYTGRFLVDLFWLRILPWSWGEDDQDDRTRDI